MDDLRSEIRAAFDKEQAGHASTLNLRHEVVRAAVRQLCRDVNLQWLAVAAALVIGVLVVVSLMSSRLNRSVVPAHPTPAGGYGTPPAGASLIYIRGPGP